MIFAGSTSSVVVASNLFDFDVIWFTAFSFSEKYHRWFPRSVPKRFRYITLSFSFGRMLSWMMNLSYPGNWSESCLSLIYAKRYPSPPGCFAVSVYSYSLQLYVNSVTFVVAAPIVPSFMIVGVFTLLFQLSTTWIIPLLLVVAVRSSLLFSSVRITFFASPA